MENIKSLPPTDRPREKLQTLGSHALSDAELLAIVLGSGNRGLPVSQVCDELLKTISLNDLPGADSKTLCQIKGIGEAKALVLLAIVELAKRLHNQPLTVLADDEAVAAQVSPILAASGELNYLLVLMTTNRELLAICELGSVLPDLPRTLRLAAEAGAKRIQLVRNGWLQLSRLEFEFQRNLELASGVLGVVAHNLLGINNN